MSWSRAAALGAVLIFLTGCGFQPLYGKRSGGGSTYKQLESIAIDPIPGRLGQIVHNDLLDRLNPRGRPAQPRYRLNVKLKRTTEALAIAKDEEVTRSNLRLTATFVLRDVPEGTTAFKGHARSIASFNLVRSDYANLIAERDAEQRAAREIGDQLMTRLALFLERTSAP